MLMISVSVLHWFLAAAATNVELPEPTSMYFFGLRSAMNMYNAAISNPGRMLLFQAGSSGLDSSERLRMACSCSV